MPLDEYAKKRRFENTPEPPPSVGKSKKTANYFCVGGVVGVCAGAGWVLTGCDFTPCNTELGPPRLDA